MCESPLKGISASLRDASLYPKEESGTVGRRRVTLEKVHNERCHAWRSSVGEFLEVRVLHSFVVQKPGSIECNFILADQTAYISAIAYCSVGGDADFSTNSKRGDEDGLPEIYKKLKVNNAYRIHHFKVENQTSTTSKVFLLREQVKRINLSSLVRYVENIPAHELGVSLSFKKYLPFSFTKFRDVDRKLDGKLIDLLAFVKNVNFDREANGNFQRILQLSRTLPGPSNSPMKITETDKHLYLRVYERFGDVFLTSEFCYVFSNVKVNDYHTYGLKLATTQNTIIVEIPLDGLKLMFPEDYKDADFVAGHYQNYTSIGSNSDESQSGKNSGLRLPELMRPHLNPRGHIELSSHPIESAHVQENPVIKVEHMSSLPTTNPVESRKSPNKRSLKSGEFTSPSKKSCQNSSQPLTEVVPSNLSQEEMIHTPEEFYDCNHGGYPYVVNVKLAKSFMDIKPGEAYSMRSEIRGVALIINNVFDGQGWLERRGTLEDVKRLQDLLTEFGFLVMIKTNLQSWQLRETVLDVKQEIVKIGVANIDSLFIAVLSHGEMGSVQMTDEINVTLYNDLIHPFDEENFTEFQGKPKIFIVQTCQHRPSIESIRVTRNVLTPPEKTGMKNIIVCQAGCPGQYTYRNPILGTYMIYVLVYEMMRNAHDTHFEKMLKSVQMKMSILKWDYNKELTCSWMAFQFKKLYFNPGIFEKR